jgi:hypothetical protein
MFQHWIEVLFSGAGIAVITAVIWLFRTHRHRRANLSAARADIAVPVQNNVLRHDEPSDSFQDAPNLPTPEQISAEIAANPPMERTRAAKRYEGLPINWQVRLEAIYPDDDGVLATIRFSRGEHRGFPVIQCKIETKAYPDLKILHEGSIFRIEGRIAKADQFTIWTSDVTLTLVKGLFSRN